jgi:hypothetical protein
VHFVVVFNLTRFARDKYDHFALRSHLQSLGISLRSATEPIDDTSTGKLMEGVLAAFAQFDNDVRSDRTRAGIRLRWSLDGAMREASEEALVHEAKKASHSHFCKPAGKAWVSAASMSVVPVSKYTAMTASIINTEPSNV